MYRTRASLCPERLKGLPGASAMLPQMPPPSALHQPMFSAACTCSHCSSHVSEQHFSCVLSGVLSSVPSQDVVSHL